MTQRRKVAAQFQSRPTIEGAGVHLRRAIGFQSPEQHDPFLLLDDFRSDTPEHYLSGFPWHPHRGIETITYVLKGEVEHGDSLGNSGVIHGGDVQWMTAGSGIVHQEMSRGDEQGSMHGFQLWLNLPAREKMCEPRYRDITAAQIPEITRPDGVSIKIICGEIDSVSGPVGGISTDPEYLDITIPPDVRYDHPTTPGYTVMAYVIEGAGFFEDDRKSSDRTYLLFGEGESVSVESAGSGLRFLLFAGKPLKEPIAWQGPIVMNSQEQLEEAFEEYRRGTFLKHG